MTEDQGICVDQILNKLNTSNIIKIFSKDFDTYAVMFDALRKKTKNHQLVDDKLLMHIVSYTVFNPELYDNEYAHMRLTEACLHNNVLLVDYILTSVTGIMNTDTLWYIYRYVILYTRHHDMLVYIFDKLKHHDLELAILYGITCLAVLSQNYDAYLYLLAQADNMDTREYSFNMHGFYTYQKYYYINTTHAMTRALNRLTKSMEYYDRHYTSNSSTCRSCLKNAKGDCAMNGYHIFERKRNIDDVATEFIYLLDLIQYLSDRGVSVLEDGGECLSMAIRLDRTDIVKLFTHLGMSINKTDTHYMLNAIKTENVKMVDYLIYLVNDTHNYFIQAIHVGNVDILQMLMKHYESFNYEFDKIIHVAIDIESTFIHMLLANLKYMYPLISAAHIYPACLYALNKYKLTSKVVQAFIDNGVNIIVHNKLKALMMAVENDEYVIHINLDNRAQLMYGKHEMDALFYECVHSRDFAAIEYVFGKQGMYMPVYDTYILHLIDKYTDEPQIHDIFKIFIQKKITYTRSHKVTFDALCSKNDPLIIKLFFEHNADLGPELATYCTQVEKINFYAYIYVIENNLCINGINDAMLKKVVCEMDPSICIYFRMLYKLYIKLMATGPTITFDGYYMTAKKMLRNMRTIDVQAINMQVHNKYHIRYANIFNYIISTFPRRTRIKLTLYRAIAYRSSLCVCK